jgi:hypothetical protein
MMAATHRPPNNHKIYHGEAGVASPTPSFRPQPSAFPLTPNSEPPPAAGARPRSRGHPATSVGRRWAGRPSHAWHLIGRVWRVAPSEPWTFNKRQGPENRQPANNGAVGDGGYRPGVCPNRKTKRR